MFKINDSVIHCREGLSKIISMSNMNGRDYFLVSVGRNSGENIYVPVDTAESIIRPLMDKKEADELLKYIKKIKKEFNANTKQRRDAYKKMLSSGNVKEIAYLYRQLYFYEQIGGENNTEIKLGPVDIDMLSYAENMLMDELSITYGVERGEVKAFVQKRIAKL
ncbi:MAG: hypothetical protein J6T25_03375 [Bacilli bacterium]|nr:hypothetical protein [Bacilli bacterium]